MYDDTRTTSVVFYGLHIEFCVSMTPWYLTWRGCLNSLESRIFFFSSRERVQQYFIQLIVQMKSLSSANWGTDWLGNRMDQLSFQSSMGSKQLSLCLYMLKVASRRFLDIQWAQNWFKHAHMTFFTLESEKSLSRKCVQINTNYTLSSYTLGRKKKWS